MGGIPIIKSGNQITAVLQNAPYSFIEGTEQYNKVLGGIQAKLSDVEILEILGGFEAKVDKYLAEQKTERFAFNEGEVTFDGKPLHNSITDRIKDFAKHRIEIKFLLLFLENLEANPSYNSRKQLYKFLEYRNLVITDDGHFLAYKAVLNNFFDKHTGTIDNTPGRVITMDRALIDDDPNSACSAGLHVGAIGYVRSFGSGDDKYLICKVNPADVVAVPHDASAQKCRVCRYEVLHEMQEEHKFPLYTSDGKTYERKLSESFDDEEIYDGEFDDQYEADQVISTPLAGYVPSVMEEIQYEPELQLPPKIKK